MSIDKFGRQFKLKSSDGATIITRQGIGFKLANDGNYDISKKCITNLESGVKGTDAINKSYVDTNIEQLCNKFLDFQINTTASLNVLLNQPIRLTYVDTASFESFRTLLRGEIDQLKLIAHDRLQAEGVIVHDRLQAEGVNKKRKKP